MNILTDIQIIKKPDGTPEYAVLPYKMWQELSGGKTTDDYIPHAVVERMVAGETATKAWREHFGLNQTEVAERMGISQAAYSQMENSNKLRPASRLKIAEALGIKPEMIVH